MTVRRTALPALLAAATFALAGCGSSDSGSGSADPKADGSAKACEYKTDDLVPASKEVDKPPAEPAYSGTVDVTLDTDFGKIPLALDADAAPCAVNSFVSLAKQKFYDKSPCNRVLSDSQGVGILQCGDPTGTGTGGPGYTFAEEVTGNEKYALGVVAMAKRADPASTGGQFFIMFADSSAAFTPDYTIIGKVDGSAGLASLQKAAKAAMTGKPDGYDGKPAKPVVIESVTTS